MAKPIKDTPILMGNDAKRFSKEIQENEAKKVSQKKYKRAISIYEKVKQKNNISF